MFLELEHCLASKPPELSRIDAKRMPRFWAKHSHLFQNNFKLIHIVGTNGKGSTGRFLATSLLSANKKVGHYSSPHIFSFTERIWINGANAPMEQLGQTHQMLQKQISKKELETLSYFEYLTVLAFAFFCTEKVDFVVMEAGMGGEFDATNVFRADLLMVAPIDIDHSAYLGDTVEKIASTKLRAIKSDVIIGIQKHKEVYNIANTTASQRGFQVFAPEDLLSVEQIALLHKSAGLQKLPDFLFQNLMLAAAALCWLGFDTKKCSFSVKDLHGRFQRISENITVDVGHNPTAAKAVADELRDKKVILVFNSFADKDWRATLRIFKSVILKVEYIDINSPRAAKKEEILDFLDTIAVPYTEFDGVQSEQDYLVFGSFAVVEAFMRRLGICI